MAGGNRRGAPSASRPPPTSSSSSSSKPATESPSGLVFLHHGSSSAGPGGHKSALTTAARAHASRRGHSKSSAAAKRSFRFVSVQGDGSNVTVPAPGGDVATAGGPYSGDGTGYSDYGASSRQGSFDSAISGASSSTMPFEAALITTHHHYQQEHQQHYIGQDHHSQQQQSHQNYIFIDSSRAIVATAGDINPPRSLSADSWDPFDSLAVHNLSHSEQFMLHYALTTTWAKFGESQTGQQELAQSWIWATIESPAALFAQIAGAAAHYLTVPYADGSTQRKAFTTSLQAKHKALKALQYELDRFHRQQEQLEGQRHDQQHQMLIEDGHHHGSAAAASMSRQSSHPFSHDQPQHHPQAHDHISPPDQQQPPPPAAAAALSPASTLSSAAADSPASTASPSFISPSTAVQPASASAAAAAGATDSMVLAILVLAVHDSIDLTPVPEPHPPAPLAMYRDMHIYGQMRMRDEHMTAMYKLVEAKGGLPRMNQTVFGYVLPPADMLYNLRLGRPPRVPCHRHLLPMRDTPDWQPDPRARFLLDTTSGAGFPAVRCPHRVLETASAPTTPGMFAPSYSPTATVVRTVMVGLEDEVLGLLGVMAELTVAFDHFVREGGVAGVGGGGGGGGAPRSLDFFVNNADLVAHRMMCLGSLLDEEQLGDERTSSGQGPTTTTAADSSRSRLGRMHTPMHDDEKKKQDDTHFASGDQGSSRKRILPRHVVLRELSRRAAMIYQDMVIFPTPARTGVKLRHAGLMLPLLKALRRSSGGGANATSSQGGHHHLHQASAVAGGGHGGIGRAGQVRGFDYLLGEDLGRLHLQHPHQQQQYGNGAGGDCPWTDEQLEVEVVFDDVEYNTDVVYDSYDHMPRLVQLSPSPTPSPSQGYTVLPGHEQKQPRSAAHTGTRGHTATTTTPEIPGEDDFLSWAIVLGAIATRFTTLHDAYVELLAEDMQHHEHKRHQMPNHSQYPVHSDGNWHGDGNGNGHRAEDGGMASSWLDCKARMMRFLWLDAVCDEPGQVVWEEALSWRRWKNGMSGHGAG
ncbi:uncharacterized protein B0I36DRAFT_366943 [Microdochium trichocladiopsis]|uniref:Uncharacterized protein n=1 Tax=Microdochium trichocladiopsis TaxID=1682393 RepID=A0A9P9BPZ9_9PEZI|nr:uncharacterized protein B0I36DRAFT_366943 [Microdochium trichocladiopsis]KAH7025046.1 hypothetical protein B0I36DRAFT_366943 [Microdochium trichocladiopsis]